MGALERTAPGLTMRRVLVIGVMVTAVVLGGCGGGGGVDKPSPTQAKALLSDFFDLAQAKDADAFCGDERVYSADMCQNHWGWTGGPESVPKEPPKVLGAREETDLLALRVCGTDGLGRPYQGDFVVERLDDRLAVPLPVFWEGVDYSGTYEDGSKVPIAGARPTPKGRVGCP